MAQCTGLAPQLFCLRMKLKQPNDQSLNIIGGFEHDRETDYHGRQAERNRQREQDHSYHKDDAADRHQKRFSQHGSSRPRISRCRRFFPIKQRLAFFPPSDQRQPAVVILDQGRTAFHPITAIAVGFAELHLRDVGMMDVAANDAIDLSFLRLQSQDMLIVIHKAGDILDFILQKRRQRPVLVTQQRANMVIPAIDDQQYLVRLAANIRQTFVMADHAVEFVAVQNQKPTPVPRFMHGIEPDIDAVKIHAGMLAERLVMVAGNIKHARALLGLVKNPLHDIAVQGRPVKAVPEFPQIDDIADQVKRIAVDMIEKIP